MPKIILDLERRIIDCAKKEILGQSNYKFSMRSIAQECDISVGTIYNYFPDKNVLITSVMLDDWKVTENNIDHLVKNASSLQEGLSGIYDEIVKFVDIYDDFWTKYKNAPTFLEDHNRRHVRLVESLAPYAQTLLKRFLREDRVTIAKFFVDNVLNSAIHPEIEKEELIEFIAFIEKGKK